MTAKSVKPKDKRRPYRQKKRARQQEETRERIIEAVVELHRTVGPAKTKITEVAEMAGVGRMTVYNHFPTDSDIFRACGAHWSTQNPPPDPAQWARIDDPEKRLDLALLQMYEYYEGTRDMLGKVLRDEPLLPALSEVLSEIWWPFFDVAVATMAHGRTMRGERKRRFSVAVRLVLDFGTWRTLTDSGLDASAAAGIAADIVRGVDDRA
jgi:AcrR family transcriptional regulator